MGQNNFYKAIVDHSSVGYSYNKVIYDDKGEPKDYELIQANKAFQSMLGIRAEDLLGKRMSHIYETTQKDQVNWNDFYSNIASKTKEERFEYNLNFSNKHFKVKVHSPNKDYIIIYLTDISKEYISKQQSKAKERILYSSMDFTQELLTNDNLDDALSNGIAMLGNATQVDRVYYWENHYDKESKRWLTSQKFEWCLGNVEPQIDNPNLQNVPFEQSIDFLEVLSKNKSFSSHVKDMADGKNRTKEVFEAQGILSILAIPVFVKDEFRGFIGFDSCKFEKEWCQVEISLLNSFALLYVKALERNLLEKDIVQVKENFFNFFNMIQDLLLVLDFDGNIIDVNDNVLSRFNYTREELLGKSYLMFHPKDALEEAQNNFQDILMKNKNCFYMSAITKEGYIFPVETINSEGLWDGKPVIFAVAKDITELSLSEDKFSKAFNSSGVSMFISKLKDGEIININDAFLDVIGYSREEVIGITTVDLNVFPKHENRDKIMAEIEAQGKVSGMEVEILDKYNQVRQGIVNIVPININNEMCLLATIIDITARVKYEKALLDLYNRDSLTGIYNRHYVYEQVEEIINDYMRNDKVFSVAIIDIDDFKAVNDNYGHQAGDYVLIEFANIIKDNLRLYDILGRYGGEEFIVILNHSGKESSSIVLGRILDIIRNKTFIFSANKINLTFSAGISSCDELEKDKISIDKLVDLADQRMYLAKRDGKNKIVYK